LAIQELLALKCRSYAYLSTEKNVHWDKDRLDRFKADAKAAGFSVMKLHRENLAEEIRNLPKPCGILCANDYCAIEAHHAATTGGFRIPDDIAVAGIDNDEQICEMVTPGITSVELDFKGVGYRLAQMLEDEIERTKRGEVRKRMPQIERYGPVGIVRRGSTDTDAECHPAVHRAVEYIRSHAFEDTIRLDDVVEEMRCSRRLATLLFKQKTGHTILGEIHKRRLEKLCDLLSHTSLPIATVVAQCGYRSDAFVKKMFRASTGTTMREYRNRQRRLRNYII
jgi:LacI family transcriptional regulator